MEKLRPPLSGILISGKKFLYRVELTIKFVYKTALFYSTYPKYTRKTNNIKNEKKNRNETKYEVKNGESCSLYNVSISCQFCYETENDLLEYASEKSGAHYMFHPGTKTKSF